jgi:hypothetical protein
MSTPTSPSPARRRRRRHLAALAAAAAVAGPALLATAGPATAAPMMPPPPPTLPCRLIDFRVATVDPLVSPDPSATVHRLTVMGNLPVPANVTLEPLVYIRQPEHWGIEVRACPVRWPGPIFPDANQIPPPPQFKLYKATLDFHGTLGSCGIEVIGATTRQTFDLAGSKGCGEIGPAA